MMKKKKFSTLLVSGLILTAANASVNAKVVSDIDTNSTIKFRENTTGDVTKPDTEDTIIVPEGGNSSTGALRLSYVPDFNFTDGKIKADSAEFDSKVIKYTYLTPDATHPAGDQYMPQFAQVVDERGLKDTGWILTAAISDFENTTDATDKLSKSYINIYEQSIFNTRITDKAELDSTVAGMTFTGTDPVKFSHENTAPTTIMSVKAGKSTNSSKTSSVFNATYTEDKDYAATDLNAGVKFFAHGQDSKRKDVNYQATITWSLDDTL